MVPLIWDKEEAIDRALDENVTFDRWELAVAVQTDDSGGKTFGVAFRVLSKPGGFDPERPLSDSEEDEVEPGWTPESGRQESDAAAPLEEGASGPGDSDLLLEQRRIGQEE